MSPSVKKCCVLNCSDKINKRHRFPRKEPDIFSIWITNVNKPQLANFTSDQIYNSYYVCDRHFKEEFKVPGTKRGLQRIAVPTLYMNGEDAAECINTEQVNDVIMKPIQNGEFEMNVEELSICENSIGQGTQDVIKSAVRCAKKTVRQSLSLRHKVNHLYKMVKYFKQIDVVRLDSLCNTAITSRIRLQNISPKCRRFTNKEKTLALGLYKADPKAYHFLQHMFSLPSKCILIK